MPTYEYLCKSCQKTFTVIVTVKNHEEQPKPKCPHCGKDDVVQHYSSVTVITGKKT